MASLTKLFKDFNFCLFLAPIKKLEQFTLLLWERARITKERIHEVYGKTPLLQTVLTITTVVGTSGKLSLPSKKRERVQLGGGGNKFNVEKDLNGYFSPLLFPPSATPSLSFGGGGICALGDADYARSLV